MNTIEQGVMEREADASSGSWKDVEKDAVGGDGQDGHGVCSKSRSIVSVWQL